MAFKLMAVALLATAVIATQNAADEYEKSPSYDYSYSVQDNLTGDNKQQEETRRGGDVRGRYSLIDADGTRRVVEYRADDESGFRAEVRHENVDDPIHRQLQLRQQQAQEWQEQQQQQQQQQLQQQIDELARLHQSQHQQQQQQQNNQGNQDNNDSQERHQEDRQDRNQQQDRQEQNQQNQQQQQQHQVQWNQHQRQSLHHQTQTQTIQRIELPVLQGIPRTILTVQDLVAPSLTTVRRVDGQDQQQQVANQQQESRVQARLSFRSPALSYQY